MFDLLLRRTARSNDRSNEVVLRIRLRLNVHLSGEANRSFSQDGRIRPLHEHLLVADTQARQFLAGRVDDRRILIVTEAVAPGVAQVILHQAKLLDDPVHGESLDDLLFSHEGR